MSAGCTIPQLLNTCTLVLVSLPSLMSCLQQVYFILSDIQNMYGSPTSESSLQMKTSLVVDEVRSVGCRSSTSAGSGFRSMCLLYFILAGNS